MILIFRELITFTITRPTTISSEESTLNHDTLPEITVCLDPGLNSTAIHEWGYPTVSPFYRGSNDGRRFIGWKGPREEDKNLTKNVEDIMTLKVDQEYFKKIIYFTPGIGYNSAKQLYTHFLYPRGRCLTVSTPSNPLVIPEWFLLILNTSFHWPILSKPMTMTIYFSYSVNSIKFYPVSFQMRGDPITLSQNDLTKSPGIFRYKTKISRSHHTQGDPRWDCTEYSETNTYDSCVKMEVSAMFEEVLGCVPPCMVRRKHD